MKIILKEFPTHVAKTNNKTKPNKMIKLNNQSIYNGYINRFTRNIVMKNLQSYLSLEISSQIKKSGGTAKLVFPVNMTVDIYTVKNHGSISMRSGKLCWKPAKPDYVPNWDIENLASIWIKGFNDTLVSEGIIPDDSIQYVSGITYRYFEVKDIKDRKIEICIV